ncbi:MAG: hypothetical protein JWR18_1103 [Segetibacter sp.]|nr:hypothetical protein [Segetibacter sp.]
MPFALCRLVHSKRTTFLSFFLIFQHLGKQMLFLIVTQKIKYIAGINLGI